MKRFLALCLCCLIALCAPCALAQENYTVAEKLFKQLWAGSGFSGVLTAEISGAVKPLVFDVDYIYVRPEADGADEHRADVLLLDGETELSSLHVQVKDGVPALQADVLGEHWYAWLPGTQGEAAQAAQQTQEAWLNQTGAPSLAGLLAAGYAALGSAEMPEGALDAYTTRVDVWLEGHRREAALDKLDDGTTTMHVSYAAAPDAIKAQLKQMISELFSDAPTLAALQIAMGEELAQTYLNPALQSWYFDCIEALPLEGDLIIDRTVSMKGDTLHLHVELPLYDRAGGAASLVYDCAQGGGGLPDSNTLRLESGLRTLVLSWQETSGADGAKRVQGALESVPADGAAPFAAAFVLSSDVAQTQDEERRDVYDGRWTLSLEPAGESSFPAVDIALEARFVSKELKSASTSVEAVLTANAGAGGFTLRLEGATRKKWEPAPVTAALINAAAMTQTDLSALLPGVTARLSTLLQNYFPQP